MDCGADGEEAIRHFLSLRQKCGNDVPYRYCMYVIIGISFRTEARFRPFRKSHSDFSARLPRNDSEQIDTVTNDQSVTRLCCFSPSLSYYHGLLLWIQKGIRREKLHLVELCAMYIIQVLHASITRKTSESQEHSYT